MRDDAFYLTAVGVAAATAFLAGYLTADFGFRPGTVLAWGAAVLGQIMLAYAVRRIANRLDSNVSEQEPGDIL